MLDSPQRHSQPALLGDTPERDYSAKLRRFNEFAEPELRQAIATLQLQPGMRVLDAGCGTGEALQWLWEAVQPDGEVIGIELSAAHARAARARAPPATRVIQTDLQAAPLPYAHFDRIWCANTLNHLREPVSSVRKLAALLRPGGRLAVGQSCLLPDMYFAWDSRLERLTTEAVRQYYRDRYDLREVDLTTVRSIVGMLRRAQLYDVTARTFVIERISPLDLKDEAYLSETIFRDTWGERLRPYLSPADFAALARLCDPGQPQFALRRPDFHFLQSFSVAIGTVQT